MEISEGRHTPSLGLAEDMDIFFQSEIRITPAARHSGVGHTTRSNYPRTPKSPSTDSTTSLAQLHDRLTAFTPAEYNRIPQKICASPVLSTVREVSENDDLSNTLSKRSSIGTATRHKSIINTNLSLAKTFPLRQNVSESKISLGSKRVQGYQSETEKTPLVERPQRRAYQSDTEAKTVVKRSRCISPVNKENSPGLLLVAEVRTSDDSVINDTHDRLCRDNPQYDLFELLVQEALQNEQRKDSGVCSKITQASDVVENTPIEKNVQRKKLNINRSKQTVGSNSATDESTTDVIDHNYPRTPKSPTTDSTTSLAQLHDRLTAFTPAEYNRIPQKICATPVLSTVREVSENDDLSNTLSKRSSIGTATRHKSIINTNLSLAKTFPLRQNVSESKISLGSKRVQGYQSETEKTPLVERPQRRAYQSDTEAKTVVKRSRCISPVNKENSPGLLLVAEVRTSDDSVINDTHDRLCRDNPQYDLFELLEQEALQNEQRKDSGVCSKITQASDVVENTPIEKNVQRKKLNINRSKQTVGSNSATDESTTDVIDDTPCYVYDRKKRVQTNTKKSSNVITEGIICVDSHDAAAVDTLFIIPTLARKINETSSEASDDDLANITVLHEEYIDDKSYHFEEIVDKEIVECLNSMIDKVFMDEKHVDVLSKVQHFEKISSTKNNLSVVDDFEEISDSKKVTLKFNSSKKRVPKMNIKQTNPKNDKQPIKEHEDNVILENAEVKSPERTTKTILARKKRKLYSPKDGDNDNNEITRTTLKHESRQSIINKTPIATCYKELEKARRSRIKLPRKSRTGSETITSPKTKKLNDLFDEIKEKVVNKETVILVDKPKSRNKNDLTLYNLSSESEDQDFKEKNIKVQKRVSSSNLESSARKRSRVVKPKQFSDNELCDLYSSEDESNMIKKHKIVKQTKPRNRKVKKVQNLNLIDERMRHAPSEALETSFIKETVNEEIAEVEPAIQEAPVLEIIPDDVNDVVTEDIVPENKSLTPKNRYILKVNREKVISRKNEKAGNKPRTPNTLDILKIKQDKAVSQRQDKAENKAQTPKTSDIVKTKKEKATNKKKEKALKSLVPKRGKDTNKRELNVNISKGQDSATVSPLPGLVVETEQLRTDDMTSSIEANLLQKFKNIYTEKHIDLSDIQNLILNENNYNDAEGDAGFTEQIQTLEISESDDDERTIDTVGRSPITAHRDSNEAPPNVELLDEEYQHRDVNMEGISRDMAEFVDTMRSQFNCNKPVTVPVQTSPVMPTRTPSKLSIRKQNPMSTESHATDPVVVLQKLSSEEIETNLNPAKTPSRTSLHEEYQHRDVNIEGRSRDMAEFLDTMRSQFNYSRPVSVPVETSPVLPTRTPSKRSIKKQNTTSTESHATDPVVVLKGLSSEEIETYLNPAKTPSRTSQISSSKVLSRKSSAEIEKDRSPHSKTGSSTRSPQVILDRLSSKDIDKWLAIPKLTCKDAINDKTPKKKETTKKLIGVTKTTTGKVQENKFKSMISPVKLDFCFETTKRRLETCNTSIKSTKSNSTKVDENEDEDIIFVGQKSSNAATTEKSVKENVTQKTQRSVPSVDTTDIPRKNKTKRLAESNVKITNSPDNSEHTATVRDWLRKNVSTSTSAKANSATVKDVLAKVNEALGTTMPEMHESIREKLLHHFLVHQKETEAFKEEWAKMGRRLDERDKTLREGAMQVLREDAEKHAQLVSLLQEDIQVAVDFIDLTDE